MVVTKPQSLHTKLQKELPTLLFLFFAAFLIGCTSKSFKAEKDPLEEKIIKLSSNQNVEFQVLMKDALKRDIIYLGENHHNERHRQIQGKIIEAFLKEGRKPILGFEFFSFDQTAYLMRYVSQKNSKRHPGISSEILRMQLNWMHREEKEWTRYFSFLELAAKHKLKVFGSDLPKGIIKRLYSSKKNDLTPLEQDLWKATKLVSPEYKDQMFSEFKSAHCGWDSKTYLNKLYRIWLARNDRMAQSIKRMKDAYPESPIIMIIGKGHTRNRLAVIERVSHLNPSLSQFNLGLVEVANQPQPLNDYFKDSDENRDGSEKALPFDYIWFTKRINLPDLCAPFKKRIKNEGEK